MIDAANARSAVTSFVTCHHLLAGNGIRGIISHCKVCIHWCAIYSVLGCIRLASSWKTAACRLCQRCREAKAKLPALGNVKVVTLVILPLAFIFALAWATHQNSPLAWVGQNLMVRKIHGPVSEPNVLSLFTVTSYLRTCSFISDCAHWHGSSSFRASAWWF